MVRTAFTVALALLPVAESFLVDRSHQKVEQLGVASVWNYSPRRRRYRPLALEAVAIQQDESMTSTRTPTGSPPNVDLNRYNLPLEEVFEQWTAMMQPASDMLAEGIYLAAKNNREIYPDTIKVQLKRRPNEGLGIELLELAGGREDGLGITVVSGLVAGGCADTGAVNGAAVLPGDSIVKVAVRKRSGDEVAVATECLSYDNTVEMISSLPPAEEDGETFVVTVKRLRRKPKVQLTLQYPPEQQDEEPDVVTLELFSGENLRRAMLVRGVKLNDPLARRFDSGGSGDCGAEGTCATCAVSVLQGAELLSPPGTAEQQIFKERPRYRMACKAIVGYGMQEGELKVRVNPRQW